MSMEQQVESGDQLEYRYMAVRTQLSELDDAIKGTGTEITKITGHHEGLDRTWRDLLAARDKLEELIRQLP